MNEVELLAASIGSLIGGLVMFWLTCAIGRSLLGDIKRDIRLIRQKIISRGNPGERS